MDLAADSRLRLELQTARAWGVPWRRWAGWEPAEVTTYTYDDEGRLLRSVTIREAEWGELDRAAALELEAYEAGLCSGCRHPLAETTSAENEFAYRALPAIRCHRCTAQHVGQEDYEDSSAPGALLIPVELRRP